MQTILLWAILLSPAAGVQGDWSGPTHSVVRVAPCGADLCATIVKLPADAPATTDIHNPDPALRGRSLCGMAIGTGFTEASPGRLEGGHLYDPTSGKTYKGTFTAQGDKLKLRGFIRVSLFGRSETWQRVPAVEACKS